MLRYKGGDRVDDSNSNRDSLADAEALREIGAGMFLSGTDPSILSAEAFGVSTFRAIHGEIPDAPCPCGCGNPARRWHFAERAFHAAFRAVPGLREP